MLHADISWYVFANQLSEYLGDLDTDGLPRLALQVFPIGDPYKINIYVQFLTTDAPKAFWVNRGMTVHDLKESIKSVTTIPADRNRLIFAGKQLEDSCPLGGEWMHQALFFLSGWRYFA